MRKLKAFIKGAFISVLCTLTPEHQFRVLGGFLEAKEGLCQVIEFAGAVVHILKVKNQCFSCLKHDGERKKRISKNSVDLCWLCSNHSKY